MNSYKKKSTNVLNKSIKDIIVQVTIYIYYNINENIYKYIYIIR